MQGSGRGEELQEDRAAYILRWMEGIRGLTDKANGNKRLPRQLTVEHRRLGIEPITVDKSWHDMQLVCSPLTWSTHPKRAEISRLRASCMCLLVRSRLCTCASRMHECGLVFAHTRLCNIHSSIAVMDGVLCCSSGAISQAESRGWPPGYDAPH